MKIVLVIPSLEQGGAERVMSELANSWSKSGLEIHLILLTSAKIFYDLDSGIRIYNLNFENKGRINKIQSEIKTLFKLRKLIKEIKPAFVLSFMCKYNVFTIFASLFLDTKIIVSDRSNPKKRLPFIISMLHKYSYRFADGIIAQTNLAKDILFNKTKNENIIVIPNPLKEIKLFENIQKEKIIISIGRLVEEKGHKYLIKAFSNIDNTSWKLIILGDGILENELKQQVNLLNLGNRVMIHSSVKNVDEWLAKASIFAFPSVSEGFPNALVEAMAAGLPVVSFDCDTGPKDLIIDGENGFLVELKNVDMFSEKLKCLINDEVLRKKISKKASLIAHKLDSKKISKLYLDFCKGC